MENTDPRDERIKPRWWGFRLFVYGTLRAGDAAAELLAGCEREADGQLLGTLYDIDGQYPALLLYGRTPVPGQVWRCPAGLLPTLDAYEGVAEGLFRRVGVQVDERPCWTYVAGPALSRRLTPDRRMTG